MIQNIFSSPHLDDIILSLRSKPRIFVFDFDGTLAPIAASPADAFIPAPIHELLKKLAADTATLVAILSGRKLDDIELKVGIPSFIYFGNHGITSSIHEFGADRNQVLEWSHEMLEMQNKLISLESIFKGCIIENKGPVITVHFRNVESSLIDELSGIVKKIGMKFNFNLKLGKMVIEFFPKTDITKGTALKEIATIGFSTWNKDDAFMFIGDDKTDEDGFRSIKNFGKKTICIKVGDDETSADYRLGIEEIYKFVQLIA